MYKIINNKGAALNAYYCFWDKKGVFRKNTYRVFKTEQEAKDYLMHIKKYNDDFLVRYPEQKESQNYTAQLKYWFNVTEKSKVIPC